MLAGNTVACSQSICHNFLLTSNLESVTIIFLIFLKKINAKYLFMKKNLWLLKLMAAYNSSHEKKSSALKEFHEFLAFALAML